MIRRTFTDKEKDELDHILREDYKSGLAVIASNYYGVNIPPIFYSFDEAIAYLDSHPSEDVSCRTGLGALDECGFNGIIASLSLKETLDKNGDICNQQSMDKLISINNAKQGVGGIPAHELFCQYSEINPEDFMKNFSFRFWGKIEGINCSTFIDPDTDQEYNFCLGNKKFVYITKEGKLLEKLALYGSDADTSEFNPKIYELPGLYRQIQQIHKDIGQVPIDNFGMMEARIGLDNKIYFIQFTKGIYQSVKSDFKLNPEKVKKFAGVPICEAELIRGSTYPKDNLDWKTFFVELACPSELENRVNYFHNPYPCDGAVYCFADRIYNELSYPKRQIQILNTEGRRDKESIFNEIAGDHNIRSAFTKAGIFAAANLGAIFNQKELDLAYSIAFDKQVPVFANLDVISDGHTAYLRRSEPFSEDELFFIPSFEIEGNTYHHKNLFKEFTK